MNDIERYKLEKKYVPLIDKYSIVLFIMGLVGVFLKISNGTILVLLYFLVKAGVYVYTTQFSVAAKIKEKKKKDAEEEKIRKELEKVKKDLGEENEEKKGEHLEEEE